MTRPSVSSSGRSLHYSSPSWCSSPCRHGLPTKRSSRPDSGVSSSRRAPVAVRVGGVEAGEAEAPEADLEMTVGETEATAAATAAAAAAARAAAARAVGAAKVGHR